MIKILYLVLICTVGILNTQEADLKKIYYYKIKDTLNFKVFIVDGSVLRKNHDIDFTNFGHHHFFSFIPENEFWLDRENTPGESEYFISHCLVSYSLMEKGIDYDSALISGNLTEQNMRLKSEKLKSAILKSPEEQINLIRKKLIEKYSSKSLRVYIVDGELVRGLFMNDFTEGGHDLVYSFVPGREIWLDDDLTDKDLKFVFFHEIYERNKMSEGLSYDAAHEIASFEELKLRKDPTNLDRKISNQLIKSKKNSFQK